MGESPFDRETRILNSQLTSSQKLYLCTLSRFIGNNKHGWPSQEKIAAKMTFTIRGVQKLQRTLEKIGVLEVQSGKGCRVTNHYRLNLDRLPQNSEPRSSFTEPNSELCSSAIANHVRLNNEPRSHRKDKKVHMKEQAFVFPENLRTPEFAEAWQQWVQFRRESKKRLTQSTVAKQLNKLAEFGSQKAIRSIEQSIERGWQGLFDPESRNPRGNIAASNEAADIWHDVVRFCIDARPSDPAYPNKLRQRFGDTVARAVLTIKVAAIKSAADQKPPGRDFALKDLGEQFRRLLQQRHSEEAAHATT